MDPGTQADTFYPVDALTRRGMNFKGDYFNFFFASRIENEIEWGPHVPFIQSQAYAFSQVTTQPKARTLFLY